jgi:hypothetical protein
VLHIERFVSRPPQRFGRKPWERPALARAFVAKAVYNHPHTRTTLEALGELPVHCDVGTKKNSKGSKATWIGYQLHADVTDCCLPITQP